MSDSRHNQPNQSQFWCRSGSIRSTAPNKRRKDRSPPPFVLFTVSLLGLRRQWESYLWFVLFVLSLPCGRPAPEGVAVYGS